MRVTLRGTGLASVRSHKHFCLGLASTPQSGQACFSPTMNSPVCTTAATAQRESLIPNHTLYKLGWIDSFEARAFCLPSRTIILGQQHRAIASFAFSIMHV